jgi:murein L,D-transpeptidase YafK
VPAPSAPAPSAPAPTPAIRAPTAYSASRSLSSTARVALSAKRLPTVQALFAAAGVVWPPSALLLRVYKAQGELEVWAAPARQRLTRVATWGICAQSGDLGPKRREGDGQVPEGFYTVALFNPASSYHLSMRVSYPNRSDRVLSDKQHPGGDIMIHGDCVSIGCIAMSDERIEELWQIATAVRDQGETVDVEILPSRDLAGLIAEGAYPQHTAFWQNLAEGDTIVREQGRVPSFTVGEDGRYIFR